MTVKIKGVAVELNGQEFIVPPLTLRSLEQLLPKIKSIDENEHKFSKESIDTILSAAHAALQRNYPDITRDDLFDLLDTDNMTTVFEAVMGASGLTKTRGEAQAGEAQAAV